MTRDDEAARAYAVDVIVGALGDRLDVLVALLGLGVSVDELDAGVARFVRRRAGETGPR